MGTEQKSRDRGSCTTIASSCSFRWLYNFLTFRFPFAFPFFRKNQLEVCSTSHSTQFVATGYEYMSDSIGRCHLVDHGQAFPEAALNLASARRGQSFWEVAELWLGYSALGSRMATKMRHDWIDWTCFVIAKDQTMIWQLHGTDISETELILSCHEVTDVL